MPLSCPQCQAGLTSLGRFCPRCGADLVGTTPAGSASRSWLAGSDPGCDLVVTGPTVSGKHCRLTLSDGIFTLEDLGSTNGTYVEGARIATPTVVRPPQRITLGRNVPLIWPALPGPGGNPSWLTNPDAASVIRIGRSADNDVVLDYPTISAYHARVVVKGGETTIEDLGSTNGTAVNSVHNKIKRSALTTADRVFFGSYPVPASRLVQHKRNTVGTKPQELVTVSKDRTIVGRDPKCDVPLSYPSVSWHHAELVRTTRGIEIHDLRSLNGVFVNGTRVLGTKLLTPGDVLSLGSISLQLTGTGELERRDYKGNVTIEIDALCINSKGPHSEPLLQNVALTVFPSETVALMGPSGAGKTTLLKALNGYTIPSSGAVLFNGHSLYAAFDTYRLELGYVPQDDIMHPLLTVREALYFTARLRTDLRDAEIQRRIDEVLRTLDISGIHDKLIGSPERKVISGGQRKRVNIAMELLCDPTVLFLDEPTSGLSSSDSLKVVQHLRELAQNGKTILTTIHQPSTAILKLFDNLILVSRDSKEKLRPGARQGPGRLIFFGPAHPDSLEFFNPQAVQELRERAPGCEPSPELLFDGLESSPATTAEWVSKYEQSAFKREYVDERKGTVHSTQKRARRQGQRLQLRHLWTLMHRNYLLKFRDRLQTGILLLQAPAFGLLVILAFDRLHFDASIPEDWLSFTTKLSSVHFLMIIAAIWFGCNNAVREIVGEWAVFEREQMAGLKITLYLLSKLFVLGSLCIFQCLSLLAIVYFGCDLQGSFWQIFLVLLLSALVGVSIGLGISSRFRTTDSALATLPLALLPMIVLAGGMQPIFTMSPATQAISLAIPSRWGYEANLLAEARAQTSYSYNPCRQVIQQSEEASRQAVAKVQAGCVDTMRAQERETRERLGPLASHYLLPAPKRPPRQVPETPAIAYKEPPTADIADSSFPVVARNVPAFLSFLPARSPYWLSVTLLAGIQLLFLAICYFILRARVLH